MFVLLISNACAPKPVKTQEDKYGCDPPPTTVFTSNKIDITFAETAFQNMSLGQLSLKNYPEVISLMNEAAQNNLLRDYLRCKAKFRDGWNNEQLAWQDGIILLSQAEPTPEQLAKFLKENPFPISHSKETIHYNDFDLIQAQIQWNTLKKDYEDADDEVWKWEQANDLKRDGIPVSSLEELNKRLDRLKCPEDIKRKYRKRFDRRQSLIKAKEAHPPFAERYANIDFSLPSPPRLPGGVEIIPGGNVTIKPGGNVSIVPPKN